MAAVTHITSQSLLISALLSLCCHLERGLISFVSQGDECIQSDPRAQRASILSPINPVGLQWPLRAPPLPFIPEVNSHLLAPPALSSHLRDVGRGLKQPQGTLRHRGENAYCFPSPLGCALPKVGGLLHKLRASSHEQSGRGCALLVTGIGFIP